MNRTKIAIVGSLIVAVLTLSACALSDFNFSKTNSNPVTKELKSVPYKPTGYSVVDSLIKYQVPTTFKIRKVDMLKILALTIDMTGIDRYDLDEHLLGSLITTCANKETDVIEITMILDSVAGEPTSYLCSQISA